MAGEQFHAYGNKSSESITLYHFHGQTQVPAAQARQRLWGVSSAAERAENHRRASAAYYARYEIVSASSFSANDWQEPRRPRKKPIEYASAKVQSILRRIMPPSPPLNVRAAAKALRRQWDPPKPNRAIQDMARSVSEWESGGLDLETASGALLHGRIHFQDPRGATTSSDEDSQFRQAELQRRVPTESSEVPMAGASAEPTPKERIAAAVLTALGGRPIGGSQDSVLKMAMLLSSHDSDGSPSRRRQCTPEPPRTQTPGPRVRAALESVEELNAGPLTVPTEIEARHWVRKTFGFWGHFLEYRQQQAI
ncbi:hypothetical protein B0H13DRAFT_1859388 [Mycena leptocephala]|nr:hypothetical protein B0H13DRAFT_1859388 [Mycena leptocephala]